MEPRVFIDQFNSYVEDSNSILITSHMSPDDDSIGSALGVYHWLKKHYPDKQLQIIYESEVNPRWSVFTQFKAIKSETSLKSVLADTDLFICTDANQYSRLTRNPQLLEKYTQPKICIDHHKSKADDWELAYIKENAASASELVYELFYDQKDSDHAQLLLLGILGDTGNLRYVRPEQVYLFDIVKHLVSDSQVDIQSFKARYDYFSDEAIEVAKTFISNQISHQFGTWPAGNITYFEKGSDCDQKFIKEGSALYTSTFGIRQKNVTWSLVLYPVDTDIKISGRSLPGSVNLRKLMEALEIGSGHDRAAGGKWLNQEMSIQAKVTELLDWFKTNKPILD